MTSPRKLIEVSLPLEVINRESAREKSIRHGHPSTLHLWWARRPLAAARAVLFAQLVDDPSSHPEKFPTTEDQARERERLHQIIRELVVWENVNDEALLKRAHAEIVASAPGGKPPAILDPFAGGGTIPLEAQRLGLEAHASDLNPVAVLINKALIEIPPKFAGHPPVFPGAAESRMGAWPRATGLAEDVRRYGAWMRDRAEERVGHLYPKATLPDGSKATVIAWIWARTVTCPNPACGIEMPLTRSWWLGKKKGKEAYVVPRVVDDETAPSGGRVEFSIGHSGLAAPESDDHGTVGRTGATCIACGAAASLSYVRSEGRGSRMGVTMLAVVAEGLRQRVYLAPDDAHRVAAAQVRPTDVPEGELGYYPRDIKAPIYGLRTFADLFTDRQLVELTTFSDLVAEAREQILKDALATGLPEGGPLASGGTDAAAYADAVSTFLAFAISRTTNKSCAICSWDSSPKMEAVRGLFARQAIPMAWDFAESNPFGGSSGDYVEDLDWVRRSLDRVPAGPAAVVTQSDASTRPYDGLLVSTDPPYYDNIGYSDLSDYFYVWLRRSLRTVHPDLFRTLLVPKAEELVANPYRHGGKDEAAKFFENGFEHVFSRAREVARDDYPITVYYAFKQAELDAEGVVSTGWATMLEGMIRSGWTITATWPVRSELANRMIASGRNALASSIVLVLRPRKSAAETTTRNGFLRALRAELPERIATMRQASILPVDFEQAVLGPGMAVFSGYAQVLESDGASMTVRAALGLINQVLDEVLTESGDELDPDTRFCVAWYQQHGWKRGPYGDAEQLVARYNRSVAGIAAGGVLTSRDGWVTLTRPAELDPAWDPTRDDRASLWEATCQVARALSTEGEARAAKLLAGALARPGIDADAMQGLAYRLYQLAKDNHPEDAGLFNNLAGEWPGLLESASRVEVDGQQDGLDLGGL